jgi:predicted acylesterase/phospholipase RssA
MRRVAVAVALLVASRAFALSQPDLPMDARAVRELRLGVVCYGGVSLAIYMYGMTRELHDLAMASAALDCDAQGDAATCAEVARGSAFQALPQSAQTYYIALVEKWRAERVRTRVVIDVISGTSAGGINGIVLAKALAYNRPLTGLRRVWFEEADISRLATGKPWLLHVGWRLLHKEPALGGDRWLKQLYLALNSMDTENPPLRFPSLIAPEQSLDLLVTATDFYGTERLLEIGDPPTSWEPRHDQVFRFSFARTPDGKIAAPDNNDNIALAFAARSSASFPVAFPAIRLDDLTRALGQPVDTAALARRLFKDRLAEGNDRNAAAGLAKTLYLVDGGVLDNYPFSIAFQRVSHKAPVVETRRVFVYLEPDPRVPPDPAAASTESNDDGPNALQMFWNAKTTIPGAEPIARDLMEMYEHNQRVNRIADIVRRDEELARSEHPGRSAQDAPSVATRTEVALGIEPNALAEPATLGRKVSTSDAEKSRAIEPRGEQQQDSREQSLERLQRMRLRIEQNAASSMPVAEEAYIRLRVQSVIDQLGRVMGAALCDVDEEYQGPRTSLMRAIVFDWANRQHLLGRSIDRDRREGFVHAFDLGYLRRRLRFVSDWLNAQYAPARYGEHDYGLEREQVGAARRAIAEQVTSISGVVRGQSLASLHLGPELKAAHDALCVSVDTDASPAEQAKSILDDPSKAQAIDRLESALEVALLDFQRAVLADLYAQFVKQTTDWHCPEAARAVLARYLGFAYWDRVSYPYIAFSGAGDMTAIEIMRFSPTDARTISRKDAGKLKGSGVAHFGAFFDRNGREKDYLWGRFDGTERVLELLDFKPDANRLVPMLRTILDEEQSSGAFVGPSIEQMRKCLQNLPC